MTELLLTAGIVLVVCLGYLLLEWVLGPEPDEWWPGDRPRWRP